MAGSGAGARRARRSYWNCEDPDPIHLARGLGGSDAGHRKDPEGEAADAGAPVHQSITSSVPQQERCRHPPAGTS